MNQDSKYFRCRSCREAAEIGRDSESLSVRCPKCNTLMDEDDEIVSLEKSRYHRIIRAYRPSVIQ